MPVVALRIQRSCIDVGGGPTDDGPTVRRGLPARRGSGSGFLNIRLADSHAVVPTGARQELNCSRPPQGREPGSAASPRPDRLDRGRPNQPGVPRGAVCEGTWIRGGCRLSRKGALSAGSGRSHIRRLDRAVSRADFSRTGVRGHRSEILNTCARAHVRTSRLLWSEVWTLLVGCPAARCTPALRTASRAPGRDRGARRSNRTGRGRRLALRSVPPQRPRPPFTARSLEHASAARSSSRRHRRGRVEQHDARPDRAARDASAAVPRACT